jgi:SAM-dependent methyltransferase
MSGSVGHFTTVDDSDDAGWYICFMDTSNAQPEYGEIRRSLIEKLGPLAGQEVLDVGSGTGDDTRELAELVGPSGRVVGVDVSAAMLAVARRRRVRLRRRDVHAGPPGPGGDPRVPAVLGGPPPPPGLERPAAAAPVHEWWAPLAEAAAAGHFFGSMTGATR